MKMISEYTVTLLLLSLLFLSACGGDYRQRAIGDNEDVIVIMDSTRHDSQTAEALHETFGKTIETLPGRNEQLYNLQFRDFRSNDELEELRKFKNIIIAGPIGDETNASTLIRALLSDPVEERVRQGESFAFPLIDHWYRDQWSLVLTSNSDEELAEHIRNSEERLVQNLLDVEFDRWTETIYRRMEQTAKSDSLMNRFGWSVRIQHDYVMTVDTLQMVSYRRALPDNDRWMWGWWKDNVENADFVNQEWINATRDSLMEHYLQGTREGSYITTEYRREVETRELDREDRLLGWETLGTWRMTGDFMGGPFVNFTYYDPESKRLFMVEYGQFAPRVTKRRFVQQFRAMGRTFQSDSTFTVDQYPEEYQRVQE